MKTTINTKKAPAAIGPYAQATTYNGMIFTSGQIAIHPTNGRVLIQTIEEETKQVMQNLQAVLQAANADFSTVLKSSIFLKNMDDFDAVNQVYQNFFGSNDYPARETIQVARLPKDVNVEISMIAYQKS